MSSIWNTQKSSTENKSVWGSIRQEPQQQVVNPNASVFETQHVYKAMPVFSTILADHVEFNKYLKQVILEHREKNPESTKSNVKAWHSSWMTHQENPKFQPLVDRVCNACTFLSAGYFQCQSLEFVPFNFWAMMYEEGEHTIRHSHFPSDFSCCYYVDVDTESSPIIFDIEFSVFVSLVFTGLAPLLILLKKDPFLGTLEIAPLILPLIRKTLLSPLLISGKYFWHII